jgi:hypothetical protein
MRIRLTYDGLRVIVVFGLAVCAILALGAMIFATVLDVMRAIWPGLGDTSSFHISMDAMITAALAVAAVKLWKLSGKYWP